MFIIFNNTSYEIPEAALNAASENIKMHILNAMQGSGAVINFDNLSYNIDSAKLSVATNALVSHLGTIFGNGYKVVINGAEHNVSSDELSDAISELEDTLNKLASGDTSSAGLYETGTNYTVQLKTWNELLTDGTVHVENGVVYTDANSTFTSNSSSDALAGDLKLPDDGQVTNIDAEAFRACTSLTGITIPDSVIRINESAFYNCSNLMSVTFGENSQLTYIGQDAFYSCSSLTSITIPENVTYIGVEAFGECTSLTSAIFEHPDGWWAANPWYGEEYSEFFDSTTISNEEEAALSLVHWYQEYYWRR